MLSKPFGRLWEDIVQAEIGRQTKAKKQSIGRYNLKGSLICAIGERHSLVQSATLQISASTFHPNLYTTIVYVTCKKLLRGLATDCFWARFIVFVFYVYHAHFRDYILFFCRYIFLRSARVTNSEMKLYSRVFQGIFCQIAGVFQGIYDYAFEKYNYPHIDLLPVPIHLSFCVLLEILFPLLEKEAAYHTTNDTLFLSPPPPIAS